MKYFLLIMGAAVLAGGFVGTNLPADNHASAVASIQAVSGTLLTVLGVWLAVMNPAAVTKIFQGKSRLNTTQGEDDQIEALLTPLLAILLVVAVAFGMSMVIIICEPFLWPSWLIFAGKIISGMLIFACTIGVLFGVGHCVLPIMICAKRIASRRGVREIVTGSEDDSSSDDQ